MSTDPPNEIEGEPDLDPIIDVEEYEDIDENEEISPLHYGISSFGADFPVDSLVNRIENGDIVIPTFDPEIDDSASGMAGFQRDFVWLMA
jgi:hypothetical protein